MALVQVAPAKKCKPKKWYRNPRLIRHGVLLFFFLFLLQIAWRHQVFGGGPRGTPSVEAYCPFGGIESLYTFVTTGGFIRRIEPSAMILFGAVILLTLLVSRGFCGWVCPFGAVQEWIGMLGKRIFKKKFNPTGAWDRALKYLKYVVLVAIIALTWWTGTLVFRDYDPFLAFFHLGKGIDELPWAYAILGVVLLGSLYIDRFFCKYACPLGAVIGIIGKAGLTKIVREPDGCKGCNICQKKCFAHIDFLSTTTIQDVECNHCLECVAICPKPNVLTVKGVGFRFSHPVYASVVVVGLLGMVGATQLSGQWRTKPAMVSFTNAAGQLEPENIRGWMTIEDISKGYNIPVAELYKRGSVPAKVPANTRMNQIGKVAGVQYEADQLRDVVRAWLGRPVDNRPKPTHAAAQTAAAGKSASPAKTAEKKGDGKKDRKAGEEHSGGEEDVKGFMTLNEIVLKTGVPKDYLMKTLALPKDIDPRKPVREWMHQQGKSVQDLREAVKQYRQGAR